MASPRNPPVVAILNTNDDTVEMLRMMLELEGILAVSAHANEVKRGELDFGGFLREHDPKVVIVDIPPPYDRSWLLTQHLRAMPAAAGRKFVLTSTNPARLKEIAHAEEPILEIIGKPYDMQMIVDAVRTALDG
jgi:DNA-binding NarL/FixJ family response regulator